MSRKGKKVNGCHKTRQWTLTNKIWCLLFFIFFIFHIFFLVILFRPKNAEGHCHFNYRSCKACWEHLNAYRARDFARCSMVRTNVKKQCVVKTLFIKLRLKSVFAELNRNQITWIVVQNKTEKKPCAFEMVFWCVLCVSA